MKNLLGEFTTEELSAELIKRQRVRSLQQRVIYLQETLDDIITDAAELGEVVTLVNKKADTLVIKQGGRGYNV